MGLTDARATNMAPALFELRAEPETWINRRVERLEFAEVTVIRRSVSIDLTIPNAPTLAGDPLPADVYILPLVFLKKRPLRNFDLRASDGRALSLLVSEENARLSAALLRLIALRILASQAASQGKTQPVDLDSYLRRMISDLVRGSPHQADRLQSHLALQARHHPASECATLAKSEIFRSWADVLGQNFVMYVPLLGRPGDRAIIKFAHNELIPRWPLTADMRVGLEPAVMTLVANVAGSRSYHAEIVAPDELVVERAYLERTIGSTDRQLSSDQSTTRAHLYVSNQPRLGLYFFRIELGHVPTGLLRAATFMGWISSILLLGGAAARAMDLLTFHADPATAIVVVLPGVYAAFIAARASNPLSERLLSGLRAAILLFAASLFLGAMALVAHIHGVSTASIWLLMGIADVTGTAAVTASLRRTITRGRRQSQDVAV